MYNEKKEKHMRQIINFVLAALPRLTQFDAIYVIALEGGKFVIQLKKGANLALIKNTYGSPRYFTSLPRAKMATRRLKFNQVWLIHQSPHAEQINQPKACDPTMHLRLNW